MKTSINKLLISEIKNFISFYSDEIQELNQKIFMKKFKEFFNAPVTFSKLKLLIKMM